MSNYRTPGVYIEEKSAFGSSVTQIETAIPVFIGYTAKSVDRNGRELEKVSGNACKPTKIKNILEYHQVFGQPRHMHFTVAMTGDEENPEIESISESKDDLKYTLYYNLKLYFENGGGACYIVSIGDHSKNEVNKEDFERGIESADTEDEITIYLLPEATHLKEKDYYSLVSKSLTSCWNTQDRFTVIDVIDSAGKKEIARRANDEAVLAEEVDTDSLNFRNKVNSDYLDRGAAYYPYLNTSIAYLFADENVILTKDGEERSLESYGAPSGSLSFRDGFLPVFQYVGEKTTVSAGPADVEGIEIAETEDAISLSWNTAMTVELFRAQWLSMKDEDKKGFTFKPKYLTKEILTKTDIEFTENKSNTKIFNLVKDRLKDRTLVLPPSAAVAGCYVRTDNGKGIWNAPANMGVQGTVAPIRKIGKVQQQTLNVDGTSGKSINVIRAFPGKGTLIWGARTLAGNDNDWRYINVRRLFLAVEENCKKATEFAVFEPNTATTWVKVKAMIQSYFNGLYSQGALVGASPDQAYYVKVGLGETMTSQDILEGRMLVEIGICPSRPAEFIVLTFTQILQES